MGLFLTPAHELHCLFDLAEGRVVVVVDLQEGASDFLGGILVEVEEPLLDTKISEHPGLAACLGKTGMEHGRAGGEAENHRVHLHAHDRVCSGIDGEGLVG